MQPISPSHPNPRASMTHIPVWGGALLREPTQRFLSWLTGKPREGDRPLFLWTPLARAGATAMTLAAGISLSLWAIARGGVASIALLPAFVLTVGALRAFYIELAHAAVHGTFLRKPSWDRFFVELFTTLTLMDHQRHFAVQHNRFHHRYTASFLDPDYQTLLSWGFCPGMSRAALWRRLAWVLVSPSVQGAFLAGRLRRNFGAGVPQLRRLAAGLALLLPLALAASTGAWTGYMLAWLLPLTWGFQASSMLQMLGGEHLWGLGGEAGKSRMAELTVGRFLGDSYPEGRGVRSHLRRALWFLRLAFLHLPARLAVYVGHDLGPAHDLHHRELRSDWANAPYERQAKQEAGSPGWPVPYTDFWGSLGAQIDRLFESLAGRLPLSAEELDELTTARERVAQALDS